jgi:hypothetical protein
MRIVAFYIRSTISTLAPIELARSDHPIDVLIRGEIALIEATQATLGRKLGRGAAP